LKKVFFVIVFALLATTGCGFQLMKANSLNETYPEIILIGENNDILYKELEKNLIIHGVNVSKVDGDIKDYINKDTPILSCGPLRNSESTMSVGSNSQALEYNYRSVANCLFYEKGKKPYSINSTINRAYLNKAGSAIAADSEKEDITTESARELCNQILFRLQNSYLIKTRDEKPSIVKKNEHIKVVFNATAADETTKEVIINNLDDLSKVPGFDTTNNQILPQKEKK
jgi:outer membrane lipopolysaccharide assembly protein LptE/RlpB